LNTLINGIILALEIRDHGIEKAARKAERYK
jgi:hypothetical protein